MRRRGVVIAVIVVVIVIVAIFGFGDRLEHWLLELHGVH